MSFLPAMDPHVDRGQPQAVSQAKPSVFAAAWTGARRWWPIAGFVGLLLGGTSSIAYYTLTPQKHTVAAILQVMAVDPLLSERMVQGQDLEYRKAQAALIRTRKVFQKALENKKVSESTFLRERPDPAGWLENEVKAVVLDGGLIRVSLTGENPDELATIINEIANVYLSEIVDAEELQRRVRVGELDGILTQAEDRIRMQRTNLKGLAEQLHTSDTQALSFKQQTTLQRHALLENELMTLESKIRTAKSNLYVMKINSEARKIAAITVILGGLAEVMMRSNFEANQSDPIPESILSDVIANDPVIKPAYDEVKHQRELAEKSLETVNPGSPAHQQMTKNLRAAEAKFEAVKKDRQEIVRRNARDLMYKQAKATLESQGLNLQALELERQELIKSVEAIKEEAEKIGMGSFELEAKREQIADAVAVLHKFTGEKERLAIEMQTYKRRVNVISPAEAGASRPAASTLTTTAGLGVSGFVLGFMGVGYIESRRRRLVHTGDVVQATRVRVFGSLPLVPGLGTCPLTEVWGSRFGIAGSLLVEAVNDIRTVLLVSGEDESPQIVMVTSAGQGEGKTTLACLLALSMAHVGKRTLLLDADLRNPLVAERLGLPLTAGFGELLRRETKLAGVIGSVPDTSLSVITAGRPCNNLIRGLSVERVRRVFDELRKQFDYIIVDSCPAMIADGLVIGACTDAALLVVRSGESEEPLVKEACERMVAARVPLLGGILNGLPLARRLRYPYISLPPVEPDTDEVPMAVEIE